MPEAAPSRSTGFFETLRPGPLGARLCWWHEPTLTTPHELVVYVHPFAEEMNKARRMAALQSREIAAAGAAVLQVDLLGCGDSAGDFGDATWQAWIDDVVGACELAQARFAQRWPGAPGPALRLWGLRAGCLLAAAAASRLDSVRGLLFWQPMTSGKLVLQQFLRLKVAALMQYGDPRRAGEELKADMAAGRDIEVAGYTLGPALFRGLEHAALTLPARPLGIDWIEVDSRPVPTLLPASVLVIERCRAAGHIVRDRVTPGPAFWSTVEIEDAPALLAATTETLMPAIAP